MSDDVFEIIYDQHSRRSTRRPLPAGIKGNNLALGYMVEMVRRDAHDKGIENFVKSEVLKNVEPHDDRAEIEACFKYARDSIAWRPDAINTERIADTRATLRAGWGDCGDKAILLCAFLAQLGHTPYLVSIAQSQPPIVNRGGRAFYDLAAPDWIGFDHIYVGVRHKGRHLALDPTPNDAPAGWESDKSFVTVKVKVFE